MRCLTCNQELDYQRTENGIEFASCECDQLDEMRLNGYVSSEPCTSPDLDWCPFCGEKDSLGNAMCSCSESQTPERDLQVTAIAEVA